MSDNELVLTSAVTVYLGLGSNVGDRMANLTRALELMDRPLKIVRRSPVYETEPFEVPEQEKFLNMAVEVQTHIAPADLLKLLKGIERIIGRGKAGSDEPRCIDIDILLYGSLKVATETLTIPHPRMTRRAFVLAPLNDLAPRLRLPGSKKTVAELLAALGKIRGIEVFREQINP